MSGAKCPEDPVLPNSLDAFHAHIDANIPLGSVFSLMILWPSS